jgi:RecA-family ATPase
MLRQMAIAANSAVLLLSHPSVAGMQTGTGLSGSTAWNNSVRSRLYLQRGENSDNGEFQTRTLSVEKSNYGKVGDKIKLRWKDHVFVLDGGLDPCVAGLIEAKTDKVFLELLALFTSQSQNVGVKKGTSYAPSKMAEHPNGKGISKKQFGESMQRLLDTNIIRNATFGPPSKERNRLELVAPT